ncbi:MAG: oligosaccharide flippase family protein [Fibrobacteraceae bacterium]|jgi:O-antigen/teichoic acid export membrane protein|nr:oligosaccharide flippase family protein [Fibrobacteraceae bacterium]
MSNLEADSNFLKRSVILNIFGTVLKVCGPLLTILLARIFGAAEFGIFVSMQTLLLTIARSSTLGLDKGLYWYLPQNKLLNRPSYSGIMESFWVTGIIALLCTVIIFIGSFTPLISKEFPWYALSLVFYSLSYILSNSSEGNRKPQNAIFINSFLVAVLAPLSSIILHFLKIPHALPLGLLIGQVGGFIVHAVLVRKQFPEMPLVPKNRLSKELLIYSIPLGVNEFVVSFLIRSGLWMVLVFLGPEKAGAYGIMVTVSNALQTIRVGFNPILTPVVAGMNKERLHTDLKPVFTYCVSMITLIQLVVGFFIVLFPEEILSIAGSDFIVQPETLGILLLVHLLSGFFGLTSTIMNGIGKSLYTLKMNIVSLVIALVSGYFLVPKFGLVGAALSMLAYNLVFMIWNNAYLAILKLWPYSIKLVPQLLWMFGLILFYILLNLGTFSPSLLEKIGIYVIILLALGGQFLLQKKNKQTKV